MSKEQQPDFTVRNEGSIFILTPNTQVGRDWVAAHLPEDSMTWGRVGIVVEHRYISDVVDGIIGDGLGVNHDQVP